MAAAPAVRPMLRPPRPTSRKLERVGGGAGCIGRRTVGHALGLGALRARLDEGVLLAVVGSRGLARLDELLGALVGQSLGAVLELRSAVGGLAQTLGDLARAVGCLTEPVRELARTVAELARAAVELACAAGELAEAAVQLTRTVGDLTRAAGDQASATCDLLSTGRGLRQDIADLSGDAVHELVHSGADQTRGLGDAAVPRLASVTVGSHLSL